MESMPTIVIPFYTGETAVETAAADIFTFIAPHPFILRDFVVMITGAVVATDATDAAIALDHDPVSTARVELGLVTLLDTSVVGTSFSAAALDTGWTEVNVATGDKLIVQQTVAGADAGTETGEYVAYIYLGLYPDNVV